jgi:hypothetical protein
MLRAGALLIDRLYYFNFSVPPQSQLKNLDANAPDLFEDETVSRVEAAQQDLEHVLCCQATRPAK